MDIVPNDQWTFSVSGGVGKDNYPRQLSRPAGNDVPDILAGADFHVPNGFGGGGTYNFERYGGLQQSRSGGFQAQFNDPLRDWTTDTAETVNYFSLYATPPRIGTENRSPRRGTTSATPRAATCTASSPGGPLPAAIAAARTSTTNCNSCTSTCGIGSRQPAGGDFSYLYEPFSVYDFAFDPTVVNSIVQPSSLVLGYVYRPYTANSFLFGVRYLF